MSIQINVHLEEGKPVSARTLFASVVEPSKQPIVCFVLDDVCVYFRNLEQFDQVLKALCGAREKMMEILPVQAASRAIEMSNAGVRPAYTMDSTADVDVAVPA